MENNRKYYFAPEDKYYASRQGLVDAWNATFDTTFTIQNWTEEQWETIWKPEGEG